MRLYKKAAACLLAAAMALSMATVCSAAAGSTVEEENSAALTCPAPEDVTLPSDETTKVLIDGKDSKIAAYKEKFENATELSVVAQMRIYNADNQLTTSEDLTVARKGDGLYEKVQYSTATMNYDLEMVVPSIQESYFVFPQDRMLWTAGRENAVIMTIVYNNIMKIAQVPGQLYATTVTVNGTEYYAETYTARSLLLTSTMTYCFTPDGQLKYAFSQTRSGQLSILEYQVELGEGTSGNLCQRPEGYTAYTYKDDTLTGEDGSVYHVVTEGDRKTVKDAAGQDVSSLFTGFLNYLN